METSVGFKDLAGFQGLVHSPGSWNNCWEQGTTPWDLGQTTPIIQHLVDSRALPKGRALVPGCGRGYDVVAMASPDRHVTGLDMSERALTLARELAASSPHAAMATTFLEADFFTWKSPQFDLIYDYTFFVAIEPSLRPSWALKMAELLKPEGELITLMFPISDHEGGPPYKVSVADYEELLVPLGFTPVSVLDNELAFGARKGQEKLGRWKKNALLVAA